MKNLMIRLSSIVGLVLIMAIALSEHGEAFKGYIDLRAALLVFFAPLLVLAVFQKDSLDWRSALARMKELKEAPLESIRYELADHTDSAVGNYSTAQLVKLSDSHSDSFVKYAGGLVVSKYKPEEMKRLLSQRIEAEDQHWQKAINLFGFLAKMAPYFGMLATVIGMVRLLEHMEDFTKISGSMALAMQGTLYGLISFTLLYSPAQKYFMGLRDQVLKRNELVARWFLLVAQKSDPAMIREELQAQSFNLGHSSLQGMGQNSQQAGARLRAAGAAAPAGGQS